MQATLEFWLIEAWLAPPVLALVAGVLALAPLGTRVLQRGVVFMDLAIAQAAAAAALATLTLGNHPAGWVIQLGALGGALLATAMVALLARRWPEHREALIGLLYVASACLALLIAREDAHGAEHLQALLAADVLWSGWSQAALLAGCALCVAASRHWLDGDAGFYAVFALVVSLAVQVLGLFIVFAALITPGLWRRAGSSLSTACAVAMAAALGGLSASWWLDAPSGPLVALALALAGLASSGRPRISG